MASVYGCAMPVTTAHTQAAVDYVWVTVENFYFHLYKKKDGTFMISSKKSHN